MDLEYDGSAFDGWAAQPGRRTVQGELERALAVLRREPTPTVVGGRTDRGVHAAAQVVSHAGEPPDVRSLNGVLAPDVRVRATATVDDGFDARRSARSRRYAYRLLARREASALHRESVVHWRHALDDEALAACAAALIGRHDFRAFTPAQTVHRGFEREVLAAAWVRDADRLTFWIEGQAFLRHMNRILVGTMLEVGGGRRGLDDFVRLLDGAGRAAAGPTAPPRGLVMCGIDYADEVGGPAVADAAWGDPPWTSRVAG